MNAVEAAILINSVLYLAGCFVAGLLTHNPLAWRLALAAAGMTYLGYLVQLMKLPAAAAIVVCGSIGLGIAAGLALI